MIGGRSAAIGGDAPSSGDLGGSQTGLEYMCADDASGAAPINRVGAPISGLIGMIESTAQLESGVYGCSDQPSSAQWLQIEVSVIYSEHKHSVRGAAASFWCAMVR